MTSADWSSQEMMAVLLARTLRDKEVGAWGVGGTLPMAAVMLARHLHAPGLVIGGERVCNPKPSRLSTGFGDPVMMEGAEAIEGFWELFGHWHKGVDFFFYSGMQIDPYGNLNLHFIGDPAAPKVRGPGVANISLAQRCKRILLYAADHSPRRFVEKLDFRSVPGHFDGPASKAQAGIVSEGPVVCVTPLALMDFDPVTLRMRLKSVHGGASEADVRAQTGFELASDGPIGETEPPTAIELDTLRRKVDPAGLLRQD
jgi:glutaconate CoA-transferase subunit B